MMGTKRAPPDITAAKVPLTPRSRFTSSLLRTISVDPALEVT